MADVRPQIRLSIVHYELRGVELLWRFYSLNLNREWGLPASQENCFFCVDLRVLASNLTEMIVLAPAAALVTSFARESPMPWLHLAFRAWRRSKPESVRLGGALHLPEATV
ncbi:hypothetical protein Acr_05g0007160 [Actinidia rufa]|uniref:Uncharacterized protein n=1 Tax=Actinidia rufa TaxID=165716 RepID=A0A7J0ENB8_9ERIC|nr:hypothetical protein Acr_05g0007160 [Actinidia rufa]